MLIKDTESKKDIFSAKGAGGTVTIVQGCVSEGLLDQFADEKREDIYVCEGRPTLNTSKTLSQQMLKRGLTPTIMADNMSGVLFFNSLVKEVWLAYHDVNADEVLCSIGGMIFAVMAKRHKVPVYVYPAQQSELKLMGHQEDLLSFNGEPVAPEGVTAYIPLVEWVPKKYITKVIEL